MKKTTKRMIISVLTLVLTVAALGTTTFAWFSLSTTSNVSNIKGTVTGGEGLEVKLVRYTAEKTIETQWMSNIDASSFFDSSFRFEAVTTADLEASEFFMMQQSQEGFITLDGGTLPNVHYLEFDIQLRSQTSGVVRLTGLEFPVATNDATNLEVSFAIDGNPYKQTPNSEENTAHTVLTSARNGARVSISQLNASGDQVENTTQVYQYGVANDELSYDDANNLIIGNHIMSTNGMSTNGVYFGQWSYLTDSRGLRIFENATGTELLEDPEEIEILNAYTDVNSDPATYRTTINLLEGGVGGTGYYSASFRVRIWIEGWDADSYDSIYNALLIVNLTFQKPNLTGDDL